MQERLRKRKGSIMVYHKHILDIYRQALPDEIDHGMRWYQDAKAICQEIADDTELPLRVVVLIISRDLDWR